MFSAADRGNFGRYIYYRFDCSAASVRVRDGYVNSSLLSLRKILESDHIGRILCYDRFWSRCNVYPVIGSFVAAPCSRVLQPRSGRCCRSSGYARGYSASNCYGGGGNLFLRRTLSFLPLFSFSPVTCLSVFFRGWPQVKKYIIYK